MACSSTARLTGAVCLARGTTVEDRARISASVVGSSCRIEAEAAVHNSHLLSGVRVSRGALASPCLTGDAARVCCDSAWHATVCRHELGADQALPHKAAPVAVQAR